MDEQMEEALEAPRLPGMAVVERRPGAGGEAAGEVLLPGLAERAQRLGELRIQLRRRVRRGGDRLRECRGHALIPR